METCLATKDRQLSAFPGKLQLLNTMDPLKWSTAMGFRAFSHEYGTFFASLAQSTDQITSANCSILACQSNPCVS